MLEGEGSSLLCYPHQSRPPPLRYTWAPSDRRRQLSYYIRGYLAGFPIEADLMASVFLCVITPWLFLVLYLVFVLVHVKWREAAESPRTRFSDFCQCLWLNFSVNMNMAQLMMNAEALLWSLLGWVGTNLNQSDARPWTHSHSIVVTSIQQLRFRSSLYLLEQANPFWHSDDLKMSFIC